MSTFVVGGMGFAFGYLLLGRTRHGIYASLFMDAMLVLYLLESCRQAEEKGR